MQPTYIAAVNPLLLSADDRAQLTALFALTIDVNGDEVLLGLTRDESEWYLRYEQAQFGDNPDTTIDADRYLTLYDRHEAQRLLTVDAMVQMRAENPNKH
jgi:hypothetical protein